MKRCSSCKADKPLDDFYIVKGKPLARCKICHNLAGQACYQRNKDAWQATNQTYRESLEGRSIHLHSAARNRAVQIGVLFDLSIHRIEFALRLGTCERSGVMFDLKRHDRYAMNPFSPSVDRIDAFGPYTNENVKIVCSCYNIGKAQMTDAEFITFCKSVAAFNA